MTIRFVQPEHVDILRQYLDSNAVVLVYPDQQEKVEQLGVSDGDSISDLPYDFGGDSDIIIDRVASDEHHFILSLQEMNEDTGD
jgi:hypothetical protein